MRGLYRPRRQYGTPWYQQTWVWITGLVALVAAIICVLVASSYYSVSPVTVTVTDKESINTNDGHEYRVYTDKGTYVIADSLIRTQFNSADVYGRLKAGYTYTCNAYGWRVPVFSSFKHLQKCSEVSK